FIRFMKIFYLDHIYFGLTGLAANTGYKTVYATGCYRTKCENYVKKGLCPYRTGLYFVPDLYFIGSADTLFNLNINTITDPQLYIPALKSLLSGSNLNKWIFSFRVKLRSEERRVGKENYYGCFKQTS